MGRIGVDLPERPALPRADRDAPARARPRDEARQDRIVIRAVR